MFWNRKHSHRRTEVRKKAREKGYSLLADLRARGVFGSLAIAGAFALVCSTIVVLRSQSVQYKPGQYVPQDILSRVDFEILDHNKLTQERQNRRDAQPRVYRPVNDTWAILRTSLLSLPDQIGDRKLEQLPVELRKQLQLAENNDYILNLIAEYRTGAKKRQWYSDQVDRFINELKLAVVLPDSRYEEESLREEKQQAMTVLVQGRSELRIAELYHIGAHDKLIGRINDAAKSSFESESIYPRIASYAVATIRPTHDLDEFATTNAQNTAAAQADPALSRQRFGRNQVMVSGNRVLTEEKWELLKTEKEAFIRSLGRSVWKSKAGLTGLVVLITGAISIYVYRYQKRVVRNHFRGIAIAALMLSMLLLSQLAAIGKGEMYIFGLAPTILVAMILAIAYDQRFATGIATMHGLLVTLALDQRADFFVIQWLGVLTTTFMMDDLRSRSRLIEIGGVAGITMMAATACSGGIMLDPIEYINKHCLMTGAAGLSAGFVVLGILPFIEKAFRITTSMTLLELGDASQPLLKRLAIEAPGTYNHSLQVATLAEAGAEAIGANSLLCRVAAYYHDVGKINKADYFIENQSDGRNRHINLSPNVSLLIIIGHVKDGMELAREYNLPPSILPFIQQHHGTTLVEYFYHRACTQQDCSDGQPEVSDTQFRYPGPKPKSKEIAIVMVADAVESAVRAMPEPNASRIETLVHELSMKRLNDGQFDECDLTFRELELVERALTKTLLGIYHGRIQYPSTASIGAPAHAGTTGTVRSA